MSHGLSAETVEKIHGVLEGFEAVEKAILFGSRAKGCARPGSDIDLTLVGEIDRRLLVKIEDQLDDLLLPYKFSLSAFGSLTDQGFIEHIQRVGVDFYVRNPERAA